jgi:hypothetical protein
VDELAARGNPGAGATITNVFDFDRNGLANAVDNLIARNNSGTLTKINISDPPAAPTSNDSLSVAIALSIRDPEDLKPVLGTPSDLGDKTIGAALATGSAPTITTEDVAASAVLAESDRYAEAGVIDDELLEELLAGLALSGRAGNGGTK